MIGVMIVACRKKAVNKIKFGSAKCCHIAETDDIWYSLGMKQKKDFRDSETRKLEKA